MASAQTHLGALSNVVLLQDLARLVRVTDILERLGRVTPDLAKENLVASRVLFRVRSGGRMISLACEGEGGKERKRTSSRNLLIA